MSEIMIQYDTYFDSWLSNIKKGLDEHNIDDSIRLANVICKSLRTSIYNYLKQHGYKPRDYYSYRKGLIQRLQSKGLTLLIRSNKVLWIYLDYFTDLTDYTKCFDIKIEVIDKVLALQNCTFIEEKNNIKAFVEQPIHSDSYIEIDHLIFLLESNPINKQNKNLKQITKILKLLNERRD